MPEFLYRTKLHEIPRVLDFDRTWHTDIDEEPFSSFLNVWRVKCEDLLELQVFQFYLGFLEFVTIEFALCSKMIQSFWVFVIAAIFGQLKSVENVLRWGLFDRYLFRIYTDREVLIHFWYKIVEKLSNFTDLLILLFFCSWLKLFTLCF